MTRAEFWGMKIVNADKLGQDVVRTCWEAARQEIINTQTTEDGVILHEFADGSLLKATTIDVLNNQWGHLQWTTD